MYTYQTELRVRYGETDQMGYLYYGNYAQYYEVGRVETIRSLGLSYKSMEEEHGIWLPVVSMHARYIRPVYYDELIRIHTEIRKLPNTHITFHTELFNEKGKLVNTGEVRLCFFDAQTKKVVHCPEFMLQKLRAYYIDED